MVLNKLTLPPTEAAFPLSWFIATQPVELLNAINKRADFIFPVSGDHLKRVRGV